MRNKIKLLGAFILAATLLARELSQRAEARLSAFEVAGHVVDPCAIKFRGEAIPRFTFALDTVCLRQLSRERVEDACKMKKNTSSRILLLPRFNQLPVHPRLESAVISQPAEAE